MKMVMVSGGREPGHRIYFITAYMPFGNTMVGEATVYKQQEKFIQEKGLKTI